MKGDSGRLFATSGKRLDAVPQTDSRLLSRDSHALILASFPNAGAGDSERVLGYARNRGTVALEACAEK
jgi:hypothetical protein